ncbi:MAG: hypothetical protein F4X54_07405 [Chloroflexi bacterium]|nr:hypothetical protein [Chloroflexota bacterium]
MTSVKEDILRVIGLMVGYALQDSVRNALVAQTLDCPHCGASPGKDCRRPSGRRMDVFHLARLQAAEHDLEQFEQAQALIRGNA